MSPAQVQKLLDELCVVLGFCLPPGEQARIRSSPPGEVESFVDAVILAEGLDPAVGVSLTVRRSIRDRVFRHFRAAGEASATECE